jgi:glutamine synthetase adenylyltransferase
MESVFHDVPLDMTGVMYDKTKLDHQVHTQIETTEELASLLDAFGRTAEPDLALATFDKVMAEMPAGVQLFSLLAANPSLLRLVADIMGTAPRLRTALPVSV